MATTLTELVAKITADTAGLSTGLNAATSEIDGWAQQNKQSLKAVGVGMTAMGATITAAMTGAVMKAGDFEQSIMNAVSVTGYMGDAADEARGKMEDLARELGANTKFTASEVADAMYDLASKGFKPAEMSIKELTPFLNIAAATNADLAESTQIVTSSLRAFGLSTSESERVADVFAKTIGSSAATIDKLGISMAYVAPVAKAAGMSIEETSAFLGALYNTGLDASMAGTALRGTLAELMSPSTDLTNALDRMGLTLNDVDLNTNSLTDVLETLREAGMTNAEVMSVFGKRAGPAALSLLGVNEAGVATTDTVRGLEQALLNAGGTAQSVADMQLDTMNGELTVMKSAFEEVVITVGNQLLPVITSLGELITSVLRPIGEWMNKNKLLTEIIITFTAAVGALMLVLGPLLIILPALTASAAALGVTVGTLLLPITAVVLAIGALITIGVLIIKYWDEISSFFIGIWDAMYSAVSTATGAIFDVISTVFSAVFDTVKTIFGAIWDWLTSWGLLILYVVFPPSLIPAFMIKYRDEIISAIGTAFTKVFDFLTDIGGKVLGFLFPIDKIASALSPFTAAIKTAFEGVVGVIGLVFGTLGDILKLPINGVISLINVFLNAISGITLIDFKAPSWLPGIGGKGFKFTTPTIPNIPLMDTGGLVQGPGLFAVGPGVKEIVRDNGSMSRGLVLNFNAPVYGMHDFRQQVVKAVRDTAVNGGFTGVLKTG